jgi:DNA-binding LacI/PurR family transcriptional regulator
VAPVAVMGEVHWSHREDLAIVSFDDFPVADSLTPAITALQQDPTQIGRLAVQVGRRSRVGGERGCSGNTAGVTAVRPAVVVGEDRCL